MCSRNFSISILFNAISWFCALLRNSLLFFPFRSAIRICCVSNVYAHTIIQQCRCIVCRVFIWVANIYSSLSATRCVGHSVHNCLISHTTENGTLGHWQPWISRIETTHNTFVVAILLIQISIVFIDRNIFVRKSGTMDGILGAVTPC